MVTLRAASIGLILITSFGLVLGERAGEATKPSNAQHNIVENKFLGHWSSHIIYPSDEVSDGSFEISEISPWQCGSHQRNAFPSRWSVHRLYHALSRQDRNSNAAR